MISLLWKYDLPITNKKGPFQGKPKWGDKKCLFQNDTKNHRFKSLMPRNRIQFNAIAWSCYQYSESPVNQVRRRWRSSVPAALHNEHIFFGDTPDAIGFCQSRKYQPTAFFFYPSEMETTFRYCVCIVAARRNVAVFVFMGIDNTACCSQWERPDRQIGQVFCSASAEQL